LQAVYSGEGQKPFVDSDLGSVTDADSLDTTSIGAKLRSSANQTEFDLIKHRCTATGRSCRARRISIPSQRSLRGNESARFGRGQ